MPALDWKINGDIVLSCNCDLFCPCVVSLGEARPTFGYCQAWAALKIDSGHAGNETLDGLNTALMLDIPGRMSEGNWTCAIYVDDRANSAQVDSLTSILKGKYGGQPFVLGVLVGNFLGVKQVPISIQKEGRKWKVDIPKIIDGTVETIPGDDPDKDVVVTNSKYWMSPNIHVSRSGKNRFRDYGRNWDFTGQSAEYAKIAWSS